MSSSRLIGRTLARSQALQILFQAEACGRTVDDVLAGEYALSRGPLDPFGEQLARGCYPMIPALDSVLRHHARNWSISRMPAVDRNLLRLSLYELLYVDEVATAVTISESVELAKAYGTDESSRFVNGVLGKIAKKIEAGVDVVAEATTKDAEDAAALEAAAKAAAEARAARGYDEDTRPRGPVPVSARRFDETTFEPTPYAGPQFDEDEYDGYAPAGVETQGEGNDGYDDDDEGRHYGSADAYDDEYPDDAYADAAADGAEDDSEASDVTADGGPAVAPSPEAE